MKKKILAVLLVLAFSSLACNISMQTPQVKTGPETTTQIDEPYPSVTGNNPHLILKMGAGSLKISDGGNKFVEGNIKTNIPDWKPEVSHSDERVTITQGKQDNSVSFPAGNLLNSWDLKLGTEKPISLEIDAGAYKSNVVIGAIPLSELKIEDGASQSKITFDKHNKQSMETFTYHTGASQVDLINLANANFKEMNFESGAGSYTLDFNGDLQQKATVTIKSGLSNMKIIIPTGTNASVNLTGGVNNVSLKGTWTINSNQYKTQSSRGPLLAIDINMGVGNLELISSDGNSI